MLDLLASAFLLFLFSSSNWGGSVLGVEEMDLELLALELETIQLGDSLLRSLLGVILNESLAEALAV